MQHFGSEFRHQPKTILIRVTKQLVRDTFNPKHPKRVVKARKAGKKLKTIAGRLIRELERELSTEQLALHQEELNFYKQIIAQKRTDKNKIYSIHKPFTCCIAKGKVHKQYEFGNKVGLLTTSKNTFITAIKAFQGNLHDSKTIEPLIEQVTKNDLMLPHEVVYDRGGREKNKLEIPSSQRPITDH